MKYVKGDLLALTEQGKFDIIIHGCNCHNTMGSGVARQIADRYPNVKAVDALTRKSDRAKLGLFTGATVWRPSAAFDVINLYTQYDYYPRNVDHFDYDAFRRGLYQIKLLYDMNPMAVPRIGIPKIGAGLAGGDWERIEAIIDSIGFNDITCVLYEESK